MPPLFLFGWWRRRRRQRRAAAPFPPAWEEILQSRVSHYPRLSEERQAAVRRYVSAFIPEKTWEGCGGLKMTDEVQVTIAGMLGVMMLGHPDMFFDAVLSILVYPQAYRAPERLETGGIVIETSQAREGEAWYRGPVILSWDELAEDVAGLHSPHNLVIHEFAHQLDMLDGRDVDGMPPQPSLEAAKYWRQTTSELLADLKTSIRQRAPWMDPYAATSEAEFFAVASEMFFEAPWDLRDTRPQLHALLADFYRVDPRTWQPRPY